MKPAEFERFRFIVNTLLSGRRIRRSDVHYLVLLVVHSGILSSTQKRALSIPDRVSEV